MGKKFKLKVTEYNDTNEVINEELMGKAANIQEAERYMRDFILGGIIFFNYRVTNVSKDIKVSVKEAPDYECKYRFYDNSDSIIFISHAFDYDIVKEGEDGSITTKHASCSLVEVGN